MIINIRRKKEEEKHVEKEKKYKERDQKLNASLKKIFSLQVGNYQ